MTLLSRLILRNGLELEYGHLLIDFDQMLPPRARRKPKLPLALLHAGIRNALATNRQAGSGPLKGRR